TLEKPLEEVGRVKEIFTTESYNIELISQILDKEKSGIIKKVMYDGIDEGYTEMLRFRQEADDYFKDKLKGIDIGKWSEKFHLRPTKKDVDYQTLKLPSGKSITMTKAERIALSLHSRNEKNLKHLLEGGFSFEKARAVIHRINSDDLDTILKSITPEEKRATDVIYEYFNKIQKDKINEISVELNGWETATEPDYYPIKTNVLDYKRNISKFRKNFSQKTLEGMGLFKETTNAANAIILEDAFTTLYKSIKQRA
ncbi:unnamed protein product, partial [marine sediment metagenome]